MDPYNPFRPVDVILKPDAFVKSIIPDTMYINCNCGVRMVFLVQSGQHKVETNSNNIGVKAIWLKARLNHNRSRGQDGHDAIYD